MDLTRGASRRLRAGPGSREARAPDRFEARLALDLALSGRAAHGKDVALLRDAAEEAGQVTREAELLDTG